MITCKGCEIRGAKFWARTYHMMGDKIDVIAEKLQRKYGTNYYVQDCSVYRYNTASPQNPDLIYEAKHTTHKPAI
jgi:hypothetical protein